MLSRVQILSSPGTVLFVLFSCSKDQMKKKKRVIQGPK